MKTAIIIIFAITLMAYVVLMGIKTLRPLSLGSGLTRAIILVMLVNCAAQVWLLLHGEVICSIVFVCLNAFEALYIGLSYERAMKRLPTTESFSEPEDGLSFHQYIDLEDIHDSMQLDSGQVVAELKNELLSITLEVRGQVRVLWNPDPDGEPHDGSVYKCASQFPEELMKIFAEGRAGDMDNIFVDDNNWFEVFVEDKQENKVVYCETVDAEEMDRRQVLYLLMEFYNKYQQN